VPDARPPVIAAPAPRPLPLISVPDRAARRRALCRLDGCAAAGVPALPAAVLAEARCIIGPPALSGAGPARLGSLRRIVDAESNPRDNRPCATLFARAIHVVTTGAVVAAPVAGIGPAFARDPSPSLGGRPAGA
jgi:hypothetical protein